MAVQEEIYSKPHGSKLSPSLHDTMGQASYKKASGQPSSCVWIWQTEDKTAHCINVYTHIRIHTYTCTHILTHMHIYTNICVHKSVRMYQLERDANKQSHRSRAMSNLSVDTHAEQKPAIHGKTSKARSEIRQPLLDRRCQS